MNGTRPQATDSMVGEVLGSYRLTGALSRGGMGTVYRAEHELLGRPAAIKLLRPELTTNDELVQRFFNEAKAASAIRHPGIIEVYEFGYTPGGQAYLVLELLEGAALGSRLAEHGPLPESEVIHIAQGIASALRAAHDKGIVHRDLKPDNVFLVPDPDGGPSRIKVLDFGIAKLAHPSPSDARTQTGVLMGTPIYMAPEQARAAGHIDHRADLYSLGCILYELLAGRPPFVAEGAGEIIAMQMLTAPEPIAGRVPGLSPTLARLVMRLLEKEPHARLASAGELQQALRGLSADVSPGSRPSFGPTSPEASLRLSLLDGVSRPEPRSSSFPIIAALVTVVLAVAAGILVLTRGSDAPPAADRATAPAPVATPTPVPASPARAPARAPAPAPAQPDIIVESSGTDEPPPKAKPRPKATLSVGPSGTRGADDRGGPPEKTGKYSPDGSPIEDDLGPVKRPSTKEP